MATPPAILDLQGAFQWGDRTTEDASPIGIASTRPLTGAIDGLTIQPGTPMTPTSAGAAVARFSRSGVGVSLPDSQGQQKVIETSPSSVMYAPLQQGQGGERDPVFSISPLSSIVARAADRESGSSVMASLDTTTSSDHVGIAPYNANE